MLAGFGVKLWMTKDSGLRNEKGDGVTTASGLKHSQTLL